MSRQANSLAAQRRNVKSVAAYVNHRMAGNRNLVGCVQQVIEKLFHGNSGEVAIEISCGPHKHWRIL
jgi:hypothetical protein